MPPCLEPNFLIRELGRCCALMQRRWLVPPRRWERGLLLLVIEALKPTSMRSSQVGISISHARRASACLQVKSCMCDPSQPYIYCSSLLWLEVDPKMNIALDKLPNALQHAQTNSSGLRPQVLGCDLKTFTQQGKCFTYGCNLPILNVLEIRVKADACGPLLKVVRLTFNCN
jgi:hypothetical protein